MYLLRHVAKPLRRFTRPLLPANDVLCLCVCVLCVLGRGVRKCVNMWHNLPSLAVTAAKAS